MKKVKAKKMKKAAGKRKMGKAAKKAMMAEY